MAPYDSLNDSSSHEQISLDWSTMSYLLDDDDDDDLSLITTVIPKRKHVRIVAEPQILDHVRPLSDMSASERQMLWWQKDEYEQVKASAKAKCRELRKRNKNTVKTCIANAYEQACAVANSNLELDDPIRPDSSLVGWCVNAESPRGLERWSSKLHGFLRGKHVSEVKHAVLLEQARQFLAAQRDQDEIARVAQEASKRARAFAQLLGQADALAIYGEKKDNDEGGKKRVVMATLDDNADMSLPPQKARKCTELDSPTAAAASLQNHFIDLSSVFDSDDESEGSACDGRVSPPFPAFSGSTVDVA
mmetsp:Transcript_27147/g.63057  ORF Transcript_27147/g.63057 Transcript_27147/m.63057 type:complete len:305 (+) Transcript_27147:168-1082(+)|eukprot:CAMPEP_0116841828 /NCGR_PEP_ID=MMETSP0418-20121206/11171_1 /TAXON_ID=1158023 /ORGANISM="Astrosyne radiata, Strain 13vi08-1A" /LENGTH=304 /DNA_ID=CAMNT_0004472357 /DNA_START=67 /DNA_END=981 /DNA_ORIENTATION=-